MLTNNPPIFSQAYLSTLDEVKARPLGASWIRPLDYRDATKGTAFDVELRKTPSAYRRQASRELVVERDIKRLTLFAEPAPKR